MRRTPVPKAIGPKALLLAALLTLCTLQWFHRTAYGGADPKAAEKIREPVIAGTWYPDSPAELRQEVRDFLDQAPAVEAPGSLGALIVPHAGHMFSGRIAARAYKILEKQKFDTVVIIAPSHHVRFPGVSLYDLGGFKTPLGVASLDKELISALEKRDPRIRCVEEAHAKEHAIEIQLPFLQVAMPDFKLVPLVMGEQDLSTCKWLAEAIADCTRGKSVLIVASSDLSHFHSYETAIAMDKIVQEKVTAMDPGGLSDSLSSGECEACGGGPIVTAIMAAKLRGPAVGRVLYYANSGDVTGEKNGIRGVVGYMAAAVWTVPDSKTPSNAAPPKPGVDLGLTPEEKALLHKIAWEKIEARCKGRKSPDPQASSQALKELRGAFVTLYKGGELRGCIGYIVPVRPLAEAVAEMAEAAAFRDPRFTPLEADEMKDLKIEISVLTPFSKIDNVEEIQVGKHGIYLKRGMRSGLLLPQVATENGWDRLTFLQYTCRKAGLPADAWKDKEMEIYVFSADIF